MQSNSRTVTSVVCTLTMVLLTILLAAWSPPETSTPKQRDTAVSTATR